MHAAPHIDISAAEQVSLQDLTVPELSPSDPVSNSTSPSSSAPVTPLDPPSLATPRDPLAYGKHQPDPRPLKPITKGTSRGTVWRARQALLSLGKRKRRASADAGVSTGVQPLTDYDMSDMDMSDSDGQLEPEVEPAVPTQSLFNLPNVPIESTPRAVQGQSPTVRPLTRRSSTHETLPSAPASPKAPVRSVSASVSARTPAPPGAPWTPPRLSSSSPRALSLALRVLLFLPWCVAVGAAIALHPRLLPPLVRAYAGPPRTPLRRLAHHAHTARAHVGIFAGAVGLVGAVLPRWSLRAVLVGAVAVRAVVVWRGFAVSVEEEEREERAGEDGEEWREDARCVWRVLRGEEEREIVRACRARGGGVVVVAKEE